MSRKVQVPLRSVDDGLLVMNRAGGNWKRFRERGRVGACVREPERASMKDMFVPFFPGFFRSCLRGGVCVSSVWWPPDLRFIPRA